MGNSKIILCPLYGNIDPTWRENCHLTREMLNWKIFNNEGKHLDRSSEEQYQNLLKALYESKPSAGWFISLEANKKQKRLILWNHRFSIYVYSDKEKIMKIPITGVKEIVNHDFGKMREPLKLDSGYSAYKHVVKWKKGDWLTYLKNQLKNKAMSLQKEASDLTTRATKLNSLGDLLVT